MSKVISFINMKGGVGKTTLSVNVGYTLAKEFNKKVLLIDLDPQMNATQYVLDTEGTRSILEDPINCSILQLFDYDQLPSFVNEFSQSKEGEIIQKIDQNFDFIPSHLYLMDVNMQDTPLKLQQYFKHKYLRKRYDVIIIDCPPTMSGITKNALMSSDGYIVPIKTEYTSLFGFPLLQNYIKKLKDSFEHDLAFYGVILTMINQRYKIYKNVKEELKSLDNNFSYKRDLFKSELTARTDVASANSPENKSKNQHYLLNLDKEEIKHDIVNITGELIRRVKLL